MQRTNNPIGQALNVYIHLPVDVWSPGRKIIPLRLETVDTRLAHLTDKVHGFLEAEILLIHNDRNHIVRVALRLFYVIGEDILKGAEQLV